jgi:2-amino-4-hydroxy-6-hydroxymethyldihydropteridine diphosphokinase
MKKVFIGLGSNLGDRMESLRKAKSKIVELIGPVVSESAVYETEPVGFKSNEMFLNMVLCAETDRSPSGVLGIIIQIESQLGRVRSETKFSSRNIDIDILLYNSMVINETALIIPHPRMHKRKFVLVPLADIAPELIHPVLKRSILVLLKGCRDDSKVEKYIE